MFLNSFCLSRDSLISFGIQLSFRDPLILGSRDEPPCYVGQYEVKTLKSLYSILVV